VSVAVGEPEPDIKRHAVDALTQLITDTDQHISPQRAPVRARIHGIRDVGRSDTVYRCRLQRLEGRQAGRVQGRLIDGSDYLLAVSVFRHDNYRRQVMRPALTAYDVCYVRRGLAGYRPSWPPCLAGRANADELEIGAVNGDGATT